MAFEPVGSLADQVISNLARMIEDNKRAANAVADKIGGPEHSKYLGAEYETYAERAQVLAGKQAAWGNLQAEGWLLW